MTSSHLSTESGRKREARAREMLAAGALVHDVVRAVGMHRTTVNALADAMGITQEVRLVVLKGRQATHLKAVITPEAAAEGRRRQAAEARAAAPPVERRKGDRRELTPQVRHHLGVVRALRHTLYCLDGDCDECMRIEEMLESCDFEGY